jgi:hypothetical protein
MQYALKMRTKFNKAKTTFTGRSPRHNPNITAGRPEGTGLKKAMKGGKASFNEMVYYFGEDTRKISITN